MKIKLFYHQQMIENFSLLLHHRSIFIIHYLCLCHCLCLTNAFFISTSESSEYKSTSSSSARIRRNVLYNSIEKCYFHSTTNVRTIDGKSIFYGQCMSMNGPDGCCLEGHYKPGICSNLGHICCTKPDPDCSAMFLNKGITKSTMKQYGHFFRKINHNDDRITLNTNNNDRIQNERMNHGQSPRAIRSNAKQYKYIYNTNFEIVEMPAHMQLDAVTFVVDALDRFNGDFDDAADYLCQMLDQKYQATSPWSCTIGRDFGYSVDPLPGKYMLFYIGNDVRVMAFVSKNEN